MRVQVGMNKNNRKELLYRASFKLFLEKQYEGVSLKDIEKASGMTRGAIFYYHKNKLELFTAVIKHFFLSRQNAHNYIDYKEITLQNYIEDYVNSIKNQMDILKKFIGNLPTSNASKSYIILGLRLKEYSTELNNEYIAIRNKNLANWINVIQNAVLNGEIKNDTDVITMAEIFVNVYLGLSVWDSFKNALDTEHLRYTYNYLYDLIKK